MGIQPVHRRSRRLYQEAMKECTGKEITEEWLYHLGVPVDEIPELAEHSAVCVPT